jgi:hypothetical protein
MNVPEFPKHGEAFALPIKLYLEAGERKIRLTVAASSAIVELQ